MSSSGLVPERVRVGKLPIDVVDFQGALAVIDQLVSAGNGGTVFTPNVDHIVMAEHNERFRQAYQARRACHSSTALPYSGRPACCVRHCRRRFPAPIWSCH